MPIVFADRVKVRTRTSGTGTLLLENTVDGFQSFEAVGNGNQTYYGIEHPNGTWEIGLGTYSSTGPTLSRDSVLSSSNAGALVNFDGGSKTVFVTIPSSVAANIIASTTFAFRDIAVAGQSTVSADSTTDTLTLVAGTGIDITTNAGTDTITIAADTGSIEFAGSTISTTDSSGIIIDQAVTLESNVTVGGDILPKTDNGGSLGSPSFKWKELFVSDGSIYIGDIKLSNVSGKLAAVKVINPGEANEAEDPEDSDAASEIGGGGTGDSLTSNDDINITVNSEDSSSYTWNFGQTGDLTAPGDIVVGGVDGGHIYIDSTEGANTSVRWINIPVGEDHSIIRAYTGNPTEETDLNRGRIQLAWQDNDRSGLRIISYDRSNDTSTTHEWTFQGDGGLEFPDGSVQTTAYTGSGATGTFFVVANEDGRVSKSTDGVSWTTGVDTGAGIDRVATNGVTVAMIQSDQLSWTTFAGLEASTYVSGSSGTSDEIGGETVDWNQIDYAGGYFVAVGSYTPTGSSFEQGVYGYSTDGRSWTFETVDQTVVEFFGNDPVDSDWQFSDVDYNGVGWMFSVSDAEGGGANGGGVYITDLTATVTSARCFSMNITYKAAWNGSAWYMEGDESIAGVNANLDPRNGTFNGPIDPWATAIQDLGIEAGGGTVELAGGNGYIAASDSDGHVAWSDDNGQTWQIVTPIPYTRNISAITQASPAVVTSSGGSGANGEKIIISGSSVSGYNGTFYWKSADSSLYTDQALTTPFDTSGLAPFTGTATLTWSNGQYIDAMDYINGYFYIGNDDEQIARTTNFVSWTIVDDQSNDFEYWNDIAGFVSVAESDRLVSGSKQVILDTDGDLTIPGNIKSEGNIDIEINLSDSTLRRWQFGEDGNLTLPTGGDILDSNGNSVLGGATGNSNLWVQTFETATPATDVPQIALSVEYDAGGNIIALFSHVNPVDDSRYYSVGKYTTIGTRIWTVRFADEFFDTDGWGLAVDLASGFIYIAGQSEAEGGQLNATLTKLSGVDGSVEWSKKYDFDGFNSQSSVVDVATGDPVMVGYASNDNDNYITTTKIDSTDGSVFWSRALDGQGDEEAYGMAVGANGEVVTVGYMSQLGDSTDTDNHMVVIKYNSAGVIQWQRAILFDEGFDSTGADADIDSEGNVYICGQYESDTTQGPVGQAMSIVKFNSSGVKQWMRRVDGNCDGWTSSIVVGPDDHLYLSATTFAGTDPGNVDIHLVLAKYNLDGTVAWQRLLDYTEGISLGAGGLYGDVGGSNLAVKQDYVAFGLGFSAEFFGGPGELYAAVAQVSAAGDLFTVGSWDFKAATFSGTLDDDASEIIVDDADKDDIDNAANITAVTVTLEEDSSNFLIGTLYNAPGGNDSLVNGAYSVSLGNTGTVTLPSGGTISEGYVTSNPTIQLTPASPDAVSQKLVIKGGTLYNSDANGISIGINNNTFAVSDTVEIYVYSSTYANDTLYWWIVPEEGGIADPGSGTVELVDGSGTITFTVDSDDYEFRVRVSPEQDNYDPNSVGVESVLINGDAPAFGDYHLHLTTGDLTETSIFLGTDDHNVRTTTNGTIQITTPNTTNKVWEFGTDGNLTIPGDIRSEGNIDIEINLSDSTQRRWSFGEDGGLQFPDATVQTTAWTGIPGPYADDEAAALAGVALGSPYHKTGTGGQVFVRLTSPT